MPRYFEQTNPREKRKITFFKKEIFIDMGGQKKDIRKMIAKNAEDTGIYEQIEKYGIDPNEKVDIDSIVMDFTEMAGDLRTVMEKGMLAKEMFKKLPIDVRKEFNNDENLFMKTGPDWMNKKAKEYREKIQQQQQQQQNQTTKGQGEQ